MKFLDNKYSKIYWNIIKNPDVSGFIERHHIIPRSMGGNNDAQNIVALSLRQHFVVHLLLPKIVPIEFKSKMLFALRCMINFDKTGRRYKPSSRIIETMKIKIRTTEISPQHRDNIVNGQIGKRLSDAHKLAITEGLKGRIHSAETRLKMSKSQTGRETSSETKLKLRNSKLDKPLSTEHKLALSKALKGRKGTLSTRLAIKKSHEKFSYILIAPDGTIIKTKNLKDWCKENNKPYSSYSEVSRKGGILRNGWRISRS